MGLHERALRRVMDAEMVTSTIPSAGNSSEAIRRYRSALTDIRTAEDRLRADTLRLLRKNARHREKDFMAWWAERYPNPPTDPLMLWVKETRDGGIHTGDEPFDYGMAIHRILGDAIDYSSKPPGEAVLSGSPDGHF